jgi:putative oxidoreductase
MNAILTAAGRILIVAIFLMSAVGNKIPNFNSVANYMASEGVPLPRFMLAGAIVFLIAGSLSVIAGFRTKFGASLLLIFLVLATYFFHDFWSFEGDARQQQMIQFLKNVSLMGTMLFLVANGPGLLSFDNGKLDSSRFDKTSP